MFGRVRRAAQQVAGDATIVAAGVVHAYDPLVVGSALALGMGAASAGAGAAIARDSSGRLVSATSVAVDRVTSWAARDRRRYARLPHSLLAVVTCDRVVLCRWGLFGESTRVVTWPQGSFVGTETRNLNGHELRVQLADGKVAVLSAMSGPHHRGGRHALTAIAALARHASDGS